VSSNVVSYITININPVIGHLGPLTFRWYGLIMMLGVLVGCVIFARQAASRGISLEHVLGIAIIAIPLGVVGARLVHVFEYFSYYWHNPGQIFGTALVGLAIYGVVGGGLAGLLIYCWWKRLPMLTVLDSTALAFPVGQVIGRFANIINGDTWGFKTSLPWGFVYTNPHAFLPANLHGVPTQPTPVYEQLWLLAMIGILLYLMPRLRKVDGLAIIAYIDLYSIGRFFLSYLRVNQILFLGLREAQVIGLIVMALSIPAAYFLVRRSRAQKQRETANSGPGAAAAR
jgi:phosphatidylglycerol:prolipoprotein diacylglycerol transferase